jgi:hypothetical protein
MSNGRDLLGHGGGIPLGVQNPAGVRVKTPLASRRLLPRDAGIGMRGATVPSKSTDGLGYLEGTDGMGVMTGMAIAGVAGSLYSSYQNYKAQKAAQAQSDRQFAVDLQTSSDQARAAAGAQVDVDARLAPSRDIGFYGSMNMLNPSQRQAAFERQHYRGKRRGYDIGRALDEEPMLQPGYANRVLANAGYGGVGGGSRSSAGAPRSVQLESRIARGDTLTQDEYRDWRNLAQQNNARSQRKVAAHFEPGIDFRARPAGQERNWASMIQEQEREQMPPPERYGPMGGRGTIFYPPPVFNPGEFERRLPPRGGRDPGPMQPLPELGDWTGSIPGGGTRARREPIPGGRRPMPGGRGRSKTPPVELIQEDIEFIA